MQLTPYTVWRALTGAAVVSMPAQIDHVTCTRVYAALMRAVYSGPAVIIADLTSTDFCGYAGTETLVRVHALAAEAGAQLRVAAAPPNTRLIEQIAGPGRRLDLYPDLTAALAGPRAHGTPGGATTTGYRLRLIPGGAARHSAGQPTGKLSAVPPASHAPPPGPPRDLA
jgi:anti-anti-sigma regulatory factor